MITGGAVGLQFIFKEEIPIWIRNLPKVHYYCNNKYGGYKWASTRQHQKKATEWLQVPKFIDCTPIYASTYLSARACLP